MTSVPLKHEPPKATIYSPLSIERLTNERKEWRKNHPHGFFARPTNNADGSTNIYQWKCGIPGSKYTLFYGGVYKLNFKFTDMYPMEAPMVNFSPPIYHPNVYPCGKVQLEELSNCLEWEQSVTIKKLLIAIQSLLNEPNLQYPVMANPEATGLYMFHRQIYNKKIKKQTIEFFT